MLWVFPDKLLQQSNFSLHYVNVALLVDSLYDLIKSQKQVFLFDFEY